MVRRRFVRESRVAASLEHPNVVPIHYAGEQDGTAYIVMRFVDGDDLRQLTGREGPLPPRARRRSSPRSRLRWTPRTPPASCTAT